MDRTEKLKQELLRAIQKKILSEDWSQTEAGKKCGMPRTHINNILRGTGTSTGFSRLFKIALGVGLKVELKIEDPGKGNKA